MFETMVIITAIYGCSGTFCLIVIKDLLEWS